MPGTPRKSTPKVQPKVVEPVEVVDEIVDDAFDLLSVLDTEDLPPVRAKLVDVNVDIRRSYSGTEAIQFSELLRTDQIELAMQLIAGKEGGAAIAKHLGTFTIEQAMKIVNKLANMSNLISGETFALLPASARGMDGAQSPQGVNGITEETSAAS
ncbi:hypothetical protein [Rhodococcus sp. ARC_M6]|uniref:hypothetical protein n=1 Tax=Rhodococcus sp. ARC_M6 TaxID=2928852 RepID=UPI001FB1B0B1|nr:hypothetical protein [Rhodococcus sp. ARC_M6]MCJ0906227.1 hypothetical protein [Rhodococcus sp. ARC_M6]